MSDAPALGAAARSPRARLLRRLRRHRGAMFGGGVLAALVVVAILGPWLAPADPTAQALGERLAGPSGAHPLGQDSLGRDVLSRILLGARISLGVGVVVVSVSATIGTLIGAAVGLIGGWVDEVAMRLVDILLAFPGILLAIAVTAVLGPGLDHTVIALCLLGWVGYARLVRAQVLSLRELPFVEAAYAIGAPRWRIVLVHLLPNVMAPVLVEGSLLLSTALLTEAALSFLGLGVQPPNPSWGADLGRGRQFMELGIHQVLFPGLTIMVAVLGFNLLGDGLRDYFDPRIRKQR